MNRCNTFACPFPAMDGEAHCCRCAIQVEKEMGRGGFSPHGREASDLYNRAMRELTAEQLLRLAEAKRGNPA